MVVTPNTTHNTHHACSILPGQRKRMLQDERHTTAMLRFAGLKPRERSAYLRGEWGSGDWGGVVGWWGDD